MAAAEKPGEDKKAKKAPTRVQRTADESRYLRSLGRRIGDLRHERGLSQYALADAAGLHRAHIGYIERGERSPHLIAIRRISKALGISFDDLVRLPDEE